MGRFTKIPQDTFSQLQLDAGVLLRSFNPDNPAEPADEDIICATTGGINATCTPTYSDMGEDVDNCPANMMELKHLDSWDSKMSTTALGTSPKLIRLSLGAADIDSNNPTRIVPRRDLKQSDFSDLWWVGDRADGGMVAVRLLNALSTGGFSLQTTKNGKGQISVELTGHTSMKDQNTMPMEFYSAGPEAELGVLDVQCAEGSGEGETKVTVTPAVEDGNSYRYKLGGTAEGVVYGQDLSSWTAWDGSADIQATSGQTITVAECDGDLKVVKVGNATVVVNAG